MFPLVTTHTQTHSLTQSLYLSHVHTHTHTHRVSHCIHVFMHQCVMQICSPHIWRSITRSESSLMLCVLLLGHTMTTLVIRLSPVNMACVWQMPHEWPCETKMSLFVLIFKRPETALKAWPSLVLYLAVLVCDGSWFGWVHMRVTV